MFHQPYFTVHGTNILRKRQKNDGNKITAEVLQFQSSKQLCFIVLLLGCLSAIDCPERRDIQLYVLLS